MDDETLRIGRQQVARIDAGLARANADYQEAMTNADDESAQIAMQTYADLAAQRGNLIAAYNQQVAAEWAARPRPPTQEEILAKPIHAMNYQEIRDHLNRTSKYGIDDAKMNDGIAYVQQNPVRR